MNQDLDLANVRRDYDKGYLHKRDLPQTPYELFEKWFADAEQTEKDPTAMVLSISLNEQPNSRVVLLKGLEDDGFVFYTNYQSSKGEELLANNKVALNFYWGQTERQIRIRGLVSKVSDDVSDAYFKSRPKESQVGALVSQQSKEMSSREDFEKEIIRLMEEYADKDVERPAYWGGYVVVAHEIEFWQGRISRLHDRFLYQKKNGLWNISRLNP